MQAFCFAVYSKAWAVSIQFDHIFSYQVINIQVSVGHNRYRSVHAQKKVYQWRFLEKLPTHPSLRSGLESRLGLRRGGWVGRLTETSTDKKSLFLRN